MKDLMLVGGGFGVELFTWAATELPRRVVSTGMICRKKNGD